MVYYRYMVYFGCYFEEKRIVKNCSGLWFQVISIFKHVSIGHITVLVLAGDTHPDLVMETDTSAAEHHQPSPCHEYGDELVTSPSSSGGVVTRPDKCL